VQARLQTLAKLAGLNACVYAGLAGWVWVFTNRVIGKQARGQKIRKAAIARTAPTFLLLLVWSGIVNLTTQGRNGAAIQSRGVTPHAHTTSCHTENARDRKIR